MSFKLIIYSSFSIFFFTLASSNMFSNTCHMTNFFTFLDMRACENYRSDVFLFNASQGNPKGIKQVSLYPVNSKPV